ncbi:MAG: hypothetical protein DMG83_05415 [Acidobacteria bacterium]|nr:MAG: hypothetical protein DMG83_05415 [Acidobacteriota bacterium]
MDPQKIVAFIQSLAHNWMAAISDPQSYLQPHFLPDDARIAQGLTFYLLMAGISLLFLLGIALGHQGEWSAKWKIVANGLLTIVSSGITAMIWFLPFKWFGGNSDLAGTYLAMAYGSGPYIPLITFCTLLSFSGYPPRARLYAMNPATVQKALKLAEGDPNTSQGAIFSGCLLMAVVVIFSIRATLKCMAYVHTLHGWRLAGAVSLSILLFIPVNLGLQKITIMFMPDPGEPAAEGN